MCVWVWGFGGGEQIDASNFKMYLPEIVCMSLSSFKNPQFYLYYDLFLLSKIVYLIFLYVFLINPQKSFLFF